MERQRNTPFKCIPRLRHFQKPHSCRAEFPGASCRCSITAFESLPRTTMLPSFLPLSFRAWSEIRLAFSFSLHAVKSTYKGCCLQTQSGECAEEDVVGKHKSVTMHSPVISVSFVHWCLSSGLYHCNLQNHCWHTLQSAQNQHLKYIYSVIGTHLAVTVQMECDTIFALFISSSILFLFF